MNFKVLLSVLVTLVALDSCNGTYCLDNFLYYSLHPECNPQTYAPATPTCEALIAQTVDTGTLYAQRSQFYNLMMSRYYAARMADALGYGERCYANDPEALRMLDLITPWTGIYGGVAIDVAFGGERTVQRNCTFPNPSYPFLCYGKFGTGGDATGSCLGALAYVPILQGPNGRWTLFAQCWNAKRPGNTNAVVTGISFNVFSLDPYFNDGDEILITEKLTALGLSTAASNIIKPDFTGPTIV